MVSRIVFASLIGRKATFVAALVVVAALETKRLVRLAPVRSE
jgi:hypothetical protein